MKLLERIVRHARITSKSYQRVPDPPFLILFINSICNMKCEHCFYWQNLNRRDDLTKEEIFALSDSLGKIENLNLSGGEPFLRKEFSEICRRFIRHNQVRQIYVPTNGWYTDKTVHEIRETLKEESLELFAVELSLDGTPEFHDHFRASPGSFERAMRTYDALVEVQREDPRLRIHSISTATDVNMDEIQKLTTYLFDRCPSMDHHNLAIIRGDRKNRSLHGPNLQRYQDLYTYIRRLWASRETGRYGSVVEPMLQWAKVQTVQRQTQVIPCLAGRLTAVVYANGDVSVCEIHQPVGNLRKNSFQEIWNSAVTQRLRQSIARKDCYCTTEVFLWPSIVFQPTRLVQSMLGAKVWQKPESLRPDERVNAGLRAGPAPKVATAHDELEKIQ